jgi:hypothetical protein
VELNKNQEVVLTGEDVNCGMVDTECVTASVDRYTVDYVGCVKVDTKLVSTSVDNVTDEDISLEPDLVFY